MIPITSNWSQKQNPRPPQGVFVLQPTFFFFLIIIEILKLSHRGKKNVLGHCLAKGRSLDLEGYVQTPLEPPGQEKRNRAMTALPSEPSVHRWESAG